MSRHQTKQTLSALVEEKEVDRHNSNLANLASALVSIQQTEAHLAKLREEINEAGQDPNLSYERTKELYEHVQRHAIRI